MRFLCWLLGFRGYVLYKHIGIDVHTRIGMLGFSDMMLTLIESLDKCGFDMREVRQAYLPIKHQIEREAGKSTERGERGVGYAGEA